MAKSKDSAKFLEAAQEHYRELGTPFIDIPEWKVDGAPARIYWKPVTALEQEELRAKTDGSDLEIFVYKALDVNGERLFDVEDKLKIKRHVASQIISQVAIRMLKLPTVEQAEKN